MRILIPVLIAVALIGLGRWGYVNAERLTPPHMAEDAQEHRSNVIRRGAITCYVAAGVFVAISILGLL